MHESTFDADMALIKLTYDLAISSNKEARFNMLGRPRISYEEFKKNEKKALKEYEDAKHKLYKDRAEAIIAQRISNKTDPLGSAIRVLVEMFDRFEDETIESNLQMSDDIAESMQNITEAMKLSLDTFDLRLDMLTQSTPGHYHIGVASTFGTMFGMFISFLLFIGFKKFKQRIDPVKSTLC